MQIYNKPALSAPEMVVLLQSKGLTISDEEKVIRYLNTIGYYRLSAYFLPFYSSPDVFIPKTTFDDILSIYIFDRKLRLITLDPVQRIEIAVRTSISNYMSLKYNPFWILEETLFDNIDNYKKLIDICKKVATPQNKHLSASCSHYFSAYGDHSIPPSWILFEELPMGCWSKLFANLKNNKDKRKIADRFGFTWPDFLSWLRSATNIRNILAHHRRFWNVTVPLLPRHMNHYIKDGGELKGSYINFVLVMRLLKAFTHNSLWNKRLAEHIETCPLDIHTYMSFPQNWQELSFWQ